MGTRETFLKGVMGELGFQNKEESSGAKELAEYSTEMKEFTEMET